jgi:hypothetical protein
MKLKIRMICDGHAGEDDTSRHQPYISTMARQVYCSSTLVVLACVAALQTTSAFALSSSSRRSNAFVCRASSGDDANIINVAIASPEEANYKDELQKAMMEHPLLSMIDATANIMEIPPLSGDANAGRFENDALQDLGVACFASPEEVKQWVQDIDVTLGLEDVAEEDKRLANGDVMAACIGTETARVCLESGRWESRNIYYPKGQEDSVEGWAASAVQAVGDLNEKRFWGEGAW